MTYPIIQLADDVPAQLEQLGTKTKFWFRDNEGLRVMFKRGRPGTGENWAEKVSCEICHLLDIPHAEYEFAVWKDQKGVLTPTFVPKGGRLILGNELLGRLIEDYDQSRRFQARQHTVRIVMAVTSNSVVGMPLGWSCPTSIEDAAGVFAGYLMLDALVGNQDRHHENWAMIVSQENGIFFAPTFDHASSLGRNESDEARNDRLTTIDGGRSVETSVARAKSAFYALPSDTRPLSTLEAFQEAAKIRPEAADYWIKRLADIENADYRNIFAKVPDSEITEPAREFAVRMMEINTNKILQTDIKKMT